MKVADVNRWRATKALPVWLGPALWGLALLSVFAVYLGLAQRSARLTLQREVGLDARMVRESARLHLQTNLDYLVMLAAERAHGALDAVTFQDLGSRFVADHPELICINWVEADFVITDVAPREGNEHIIGLPLILPEPQRASRLAMTERRPVYTRAFDVIQGVRAFEVWVPVFDGDTFLGLLGGAYSYENLLGVVVGQGVRARNLVSVVDDAGVPIVDPVATGVLDRTLEREIELTPSENGARLKLSPYVRGMSGHLMRGLELACLALVVGMVLAMWRLRREVDAHRRTERALGASEAKARGIIDHVGLGVAVVDPEMVVLDTNPRVREWFPVADPGRQLHCFEWFCQEKRDNVCEECPVSRTLRDGVVHAATRTVLRDGVTRSYHQVSSPVLDEEGRVTAAIVIIEDVTERLAAQAQASQNQKMEAIGRLAGGVAHDFNNMLQVILGHAELALDECGPDDAVAGNIREIVGAADRSAGLVAQLLAFARRQVTAPRNLDLNATIDGTISMLQRLIGENIALEWRPGDDVWPVRMDPAQLDQVLANLCVNARDAVGDTGNIVIETGNGAFDEAWCAANPDFKPGDYALLTVSDDGCGMDRETQARLFEPFFTTKSLGRGTGLGLATVYGIVRQNGGFIKVYSEPGRGTTFRICLPRHADEAALPPAEETMAAAATGNEVLLLVEDEPRLLSMAQAMLTRLGYRVVAQGSPEAALAAAAQLEGPIDLLVTDVIMPGMDGRELSRRLCERRPDLRTLFMSGYSGNIIAHHGVLEPGVHFLQKPFTTRDLAAAVRAALD